MCKTVYVGTYVLNDFTGIYLVVSFYKLTNVNCYCFNSKDVLKHCSRNLVR